MVDLEKLGNSGAALDISTSESERAALAKRFGFLGLPAFSRVGKGLAIQGWS